MQNLDKVNQAFDQMFLGDKNLPAKRVGNRQASNVNRASKGFGLDSNAMSNKDGFCGAERHSKT